MSSKVQRIATAVALVALGTFIGGAALFWLQRQRPWSEAVPNRNEAREKEQQERSFALDDAYKKPPTTFSDTGGARLYGRVLHDIEDGEAVLAATSPQALDSELADNKSLEADIRLARARYEQAVGSAVAGAATYQSMMPGYGDNRFRDAANLTEFEIQTREKEQPKFQVALKETETKFRARRAELLEKQMIFHIPDDIRVRVLDVADHYAKVQALEPPLEKVFFVTSDRLLVK